MKYYSPIMIHEPGSYRKVYVPKEPLVADYYFVTKYGEVYSLYSMQTLMQYTNTKGYKLVSMQTTDGRRIQERVHRLVKYAFDYIPGCEDLQIDHIDGDKSNNNLENLEWVSAQENINRREQNIIRTPSLKTDDIISILQMIIKGYSDDLIIEIIPNCTTMKIGEILQGRHKTIPTDLLLKAREVRSAMIRKANRTTLSEEKLHEICKYFEDHKPPYDKFKENLFNKRKYLSEAMDSLGLDYNDDNQRAMVRRLLNKEDNVAIYSNYNY